MRENYTLTRLYTDDSLHVGATLNLSKDHTHYLQNVLRMSEGDSLKLFNGRDGEWRADISALTKRSATVRVVERLRPQHTVPDIWLCFAPIRRHRNAFILEKATELGVAVLQPVLTQRTQFGKLKLDKLTSQIIEAAEQTERLCLPELNNPASLDEMLKDWNVNRILIMADEEGDCPPAFDVFQDLSGPVALLTGPEGGFTPQERERLRAQDYVKPVSLGPRILRADTAALAMLSLWQAVQGDWT